MLEYAFLAAVKANASRWSGAGAEVVGLPPDFLLRYLEGLREAAKDGATLNGNALVRLLEEGLVAGRTWLSPGYEDVRKSAEWIALHTAPPVPPTPAFTPASPATCPTVPRSRYSS